MATESAQLRKGLVELNITAAREGSNEALGNLFATCRDYLLVVANRELPTDVRVKIAASDVVQETLLAAQQEFGRFEGRDETELLAWLRRILLRQLSIFDRRYRRTSKRALSREVPLDGFSSVIGPSVGLATGRTKSPSHIAAAREDREAIERALATLPTDYRQVLVLRFREHRSFAEIGRALGRSDEAARKLWLRALGKLKQVYRA